MLHINQNKIITMAEQKFIDGVKAFKPKADFIKAELVISLNQFVKFCKDNPEILSEYNGEKQIKVQVKESKSGTWYASLNEYKPKTSEKTQYNRRTNIDESLPF